jgi:cytochrome c553
MVVAGCVAAALVSASAGAADVMAGKTKFAVCAGCHGPNGTGNVALGYPQLAGKTAAYIEEQLRAFKSGKRDNATMKAMSAGLNERDIEDVAAYIATL